MPPHFIEFRHSKFLTDVLLPWIRENYNLNKIMLVQDSAPAQVAKKVQTYLKENLPTYVPKDICPSSSPDLNVCDNSLFSVIEEHSNATSHSHSSVKSLKTTIR